MSDHQKILIQDAVGYQTRLCWKTHSKELGGRVDLIKKGWTGSEGVGLDKEKSVGHSSRHLPAGCSSSYYGMSWGMTCTLPLPLCNIQKQGPSSMVYLCAALESQQLFR